MTPVQSPPPLVSVILPSYNYGRYLPQRIQSIVDQTFRDFELIVIDDASTDDSAAIIARYEDDPRLRAVYCDENSGSVYQRWNEGAALARGQYLWFAGADDYCEPTLLEQLVLLIERHPFTGIAFARSWMVDETGRPLFCAPAWTRSETREGRVARGILLLDTTIANASAVLLRTEIFRELGGFDLSFRYAADWKLYLDILQTYDLAYVAELLNYCRMHPTSASVQARRSGAETLERYRLIDEVCRRCPDLDEFRDSALDREAQRCLINAANSIRRGSFLPALRILSAGERTDHSHIRRMLKHLPYLGKAIGAKLLAGSGLIDSGRAAHQAIP